jgi:hypothetical protein
MCDVTIPQRDQTSPEKEGPKAQEKRASVPPLLKKEGKWKKETIFSGIFENSADLLSPPPLALK